jgi:hypothetical protein
MFIPMIKNIFAKDSKKSRLRPKGPAPFVSFSRQINFVKDTAGSSLRRREGSLPPKPKFFPVALELKIVMPANLHDDGDRRNAVAPSGLVHLDRTKEKVMKMRTLMLASVFAVSSSLAFAAGGGGGGGAGGGAGGAGGGAAGGAATGGASAGSSSGTSSPGGGMGTSGTGTTGMGTGGIGSSNLGAGGGGLGTGGGNLGTGGGGLGTGGGSLGTGGGNLGTGGANQNGSSGGMGTTTSPEGK